MLHSFTKIDEELFEELEELLVMADVGVTTAERNLRYSSAQRDERDAASPTRTRSMTLLQEIVTEMVSGDDELHALPRSHPSSLSSA